MKVVKAIMGLVVGLACSAVPASPATAAPTGTPMSCGMVVREDVTLYLTKDLHCATFVVATASPYEEGTTAVHIVLNLRGHTLFGPGSGRGVSAIGSTFKPPTLEVNDGRLTGWDEAISGDGLTRLRNVVLSRNRIGFGCDGTCIVDNSVFDGNTEYGLYGYQDCVATITNSIFRRNGIGASVSRGLSFLNIADSMFVANGIGAAGRVDTHLSVARSLFVRNRTAISYVDDWDDGVVQCARLEDNTFVRNGVDVSGSAC